MPSLCKQLLDETPSFEDLQHVSEQYYITIRNLKRAQSSSPDRFEESLKDLTFVTKSRAAIVSDASSSQRGTDSLTSLPSSSAATIPNAAPLSDGPKRHKMIRTLSEATAALNEAARAQDRESVRKIMSLRQTLFRSTKKRQRSKDDEGEDGISRKRARGLLNRCVSRVVEDGESKTVNQENFETFIGKLCEKLMVVNCRQQLALVKRGLHKVIPARLLRPLICHEELALLLEGDKDVSVDLWKSNTEYLGSTHEEALQVSWFWEYAEKLPSEKKRCLLQWCTGWRSISRKGFGQFKFKIQVVPVEADEDMERLPTSSTCGFLIAIPAYSSREVLESKFDYAIKEAMGFGVL